MNMEWFNTGDLMIHCEENPNIEITGINGLRTLLAMVASSWGQGLPVIMKAKEVRLIPMENKPEYIHYKIFKGG